MVKLAWIRVSFALSSLTFIVFLVSVCICFFTGLSGTDLNLFLPPWTGFWPTTTGAGDLSGCWREKLTWAKAHRCLSATGDLQAIKVRVMRGSLVPEVNQAVMETQPPPLTIASGEWRQDKTHGFFHASCKNNSGRTQANISFIIQWVKDPFKRVWYHGNVHLVCVQQLLIILIYEWIDAAVFPAWLTHVFLCKPDSPWK